MFLHIGNNKNIREKDILGIFDTDAATVSGTTRRYLARAEKQGNVESATEEIPKSFILFRKKGGYGVCFSQISSTALLGRSGSAQYEEAKG
ncbi:MAG: DUF370 domain-containing protein [Ruminococcaceae bacterium]|nr:DUF370 domain-containing protein [Oscillospiraceae bacterium]